MCPEGIRRYQKILEGTEQFQEGARNPEGTRKFAENTKSIPKGTRM